MVDNKFQHTERKTWHRWTFYINIIMFVIIAISIFFLVIDSYYSGKLAHEGVGGDVFATAWVHIMRDIVIIAIALTWIFIQLFRNQWLIIKRNW